MKIGISIAPSDALPSAFVVLRGLEESIPKAAAMGYDGVEISLFHRSQIDLPAVKIMLDSCGLKVPCITTGQIFAQQGVYFTSANSAVRGRAQDAFRGLTDVAAEFGAMINIGRIRGTVDPGQTVGQAEENFIASVDALADYAARCGVTIVLEPVNRYEINYIQTMAEGAALMRKIGRHNLKLMPDTFHMNIEDPSILSVLVENIGQTAYVHVSDSNRLAPGQGHLPWRDIVDTLGVSGYEGWLTAEVLPLPTPDVAAEQAVSFLRCFLPKI